MYTGRSEILLEGILAELRRLNARLEGPAAVPPVLSNTCPRCHLNLEGSMGYVCSDPACPSQYGRVTAHSGT